MRLKVVNTLFTFITIQPPFANARLIALSVGFVLAMVVLPRAHALDFVQAYEQAKQNDPAIAMAKANYLAEKQTLEQGKALLKPSVSVHARAGKSRYKSNAPQLNIKDVPDLSACTSIPTNAPIVQIGEGFLECYSEVVTNISIDDSTNSSFTGTEFGVAVTQSLYDQSRWSKYNQAKIIGQRASVLYQQAAADVIFNVAEAYVLSLQALDALKNSHKENKTLASQLRYVESQLKNGVGRASDLYELSSVKQVQASQEIVLQSALDGALGRLSSLLGRAVTQAELKNFKRDISMKPLEPVRQQSWIELSRKYNLQLRSIGVDVRLAQAEYQSSKKSRWPVLNLLASYRKTKTSGGQGFAPGAETAFVGVDMSAPVYQGGAHKATQKKAYHQYQATKHRARQQQQQLEMAISNLHTQIAANVANYHVVTSSLRLAKRADKTLSQGASQGVTTVAEVFRARKKVQQIQTNLEAIRFEYLLNKLKLRQLVGVLSEADLHALNKLL